MLTRHPVVILATFASAVLGLAGCSGAPQGAAVGNDPARPAGVFRGDFEHVLLLSGELEAVRSIAIKAPQTAIFQMRIQYLAEEGSAVKAGDPLLEFDNSSRGAQVLDLETRILDARTQVGTRRSELASALKDLEIQLAEAEYALAVAKLEAGVDADVLSRKVYGERQLAREKAEKESAETKERMRLTKERGKADLDVLLIEQGKLEQDLVAAQRDIELLSIKAPIDGIVVHERRQENNLRYQEGDSCWPGQGVLQLPDLSEMQVLFAVNEVDAPLIRVGMPVALILDAFPGREAHGTITRVPAMAVKRGEDSTVAVFKVVASLEETWTSEMKPGMSVLGRVVVERQLDVPLVSRSAVTCEEGSCFIQVVARRGRKAERVPVSPLARDAASYLLSEEDAARVLALAGGV